MNTPDQDLANKLITLYQLNEQFGDLLSDEQKQTIVDEAFSLVFDEPSGIIVPAIEIVKN